MPRGPRIAAGGLLYHVLNRGVGRQTLFPASLPAQDDPHLLIVCRYVERNALRAGLVQRAERWRWSSLWRREAGRDLGMLSPWPVDRPADWLDWVNEPQTDAEMEVLRRSVNRASPFGHERWQRHTATNLGLGATLRPLGRPRSVAIGADRRQGEL